jgi:tripartite-type tricarboxylate transporter receptor subunit TctC
MSSISLLLRPLMAVLLLALGARGVGAQSYPAKPVRIIAPAAAGTNPDVLARLVGQKLQEILGQPFIVENRPGAGGAIAADVAAKSVADGYTLLLSDTGPFAIWPALNPKLPYEPVRDFVAVSGLVYVPTVLAVHPSVGATTLAQLIDTAKKKPGELKYGTFGPGSIHHLTAEIFSSAAGVQLTHVPFKGGAEFIGSLVNGDIQMAFFGTPLVMPHVKEGRLRAIGISTAQRSEALPDLPTLSELGLSGFDVAASIGMVAPARTPREVVATLEGALAKTMQDRKIAERTSALGMIPIPVGATRYDAMIKAELDKYGRAVKAAGLKIE